MNRLTLTIDGTSHTVPAGTTVGALLQQLGIPLRRSPRARQPRGLFCGMGSCFECTIRVDGESEVRACLTLVAENMVVETMR